ISITDGTNVIKPIETVTGLPKAAGYYAGNEVPWEWRGENSAGTGFVVDGQYYLRYVAQPATIVGQTIPNASQVMTFPVKLDSVSPVVTITSIDPIPSGRQVNWTISDAAPSSGIWGFDVWYTNGTGSHHKMVSPATTSYVIPADATDANVYAFDNANNVSSFEAATVHTILATAIGSGIVAPSGAVSVPFGSDQSFTFMPSSAGLNVVKVAVDGVAVQALVGFTFHHVVADHTLQVTFADVTPPLLNLPTVMGGLVYTSLNPWLLPFEAMDTSGSVVLMTVRDNGTIILNRVPSVSPLSLNLADGMHSIQITAEDTAGNATVKSFLLLVDTHGPIVDVTTPATPVNVPAYVLTGSVVDPVSGLRSLTVNDVDDATYLDGTFNHPVTLKKGVNTFVIIAIDNMGNKTVREVQVELNFAQPHPSYKTVTLTIGKAEMDVNGMPVAMDAAPVIKNGRTLLPIRALIETLGGKVMWDAKTRTATVVLGERSVVLEVGKSTALVNGKSVPIDATNDKVVPEIIGSRTFLPLRFIAESLGLDLAWEPVSKTVSFTYWP
ncbi:MAG: stalk domain-containing protein, partial [Caldiserica bacterium]|nr:stalk domain-containing protein [Caldisericota bacterium]